MDILADTAAAWGIPLSPPQLEQFTTYAAELRRWNERVNLTTITGARAIITRHFLDSLRCALSWGDAPRSLIDIGTGAGFPGLPLKILRPALHVTLVESIARKAAFLEHITEALGLDGVAVVVGRAEAAGQAAEYRERYDVAVARAVADLRVLAEYCLPLVRVGGRFLAPKGAQIDDEVAAAQPAIRQLGGRVLAVEPVAVPGVEQRSLVVVAKATPTPERYPRAPGIPAKRPL